MGALQELLRVNVILLYDVAAGVPSRIGLKSVNILLACRQH